MEKTILIPPLPTQFCIIIKQKISNLSIPDCGLYFQIKVRQEKTCNIWKRDVFKKKLRGQLLLSFVQIMAQRLQMKTLNVSTLTLNWMNKVPQLVLVDLAEWHSPKSVYNLDLKL